MDNDYIRQLHADGSSFFNLVRKACDQENRGREEDGSNRWFRFSSWCRFPFYEADFGWGKTIWVGSALRVNNACVFLETRC